MKRRHLLSISLVAFLGLAAVGCKKSMPEPWKVYGFPTENLKETDSGDLQNRLNATYTTQAGVATLQATSLLREYGTKIKAQGFNQTCTGEYRYSDGDRAFLDGYTKGADKLGVVSIFNDKGKLILTVTKAYEKDDTYGALLTSNCKPMK